MTGIEQMDLLDADRTVVIARGQDRGALADGGCLAVVFGRPLRIDSSPRGSNVRRQLWITRPPGTESVRSGRRLGGSFPGAACAAPPGPLTVDFTSTDAAIAKVRVSGLSSAETSALRAASLDRSAWQRILLVSTEH